MNISKLEQETIINFNEAEDTTTIYTYNKKLIRQLEEYSAEFPEIARKTRDDGTGGVTYEVKKRAVSYRFKKPYSEEQKAAARERAMQRGFGNRTKSHNTSIS